MTAHDRVMGMLRGKPVDRVPLNVFAGWNPGVRRKVAEKFGSIENFCQRTHIDVVTGVLPRFAFGSPQAHAEIADLDRYLELPMVDPSTPAFLHQHCDADLFLSVTEALAAHAKTMPVFVHAWGVFELSQFLFEKNGRPGTEEALVNMLAEPEKTKRVYLELAEWTAAAVENAIRAGADVIELSDDWGQQATMLFSPKSWWEMIYPATKIIVDTARKHDVPVLLHSDGDISMILDGVKQLGIQALHPVQESAGMSLTKTRAALGSGFCIMGGLDTITALPTMGAEAIRTEVKRIFAVLKPSGPFIFCGSHMFQDDAPLEVIEAAYETAYELAEF